MPPTNFPVPPSGPAPGPQQQPLVVQGANPQQPQLDKQIAPPTDPAAGQLQLLMQGLAAQQAALAKAQEETFDVKFVRCVKSGRLRVKALPPEDFMIDPDAARIHEEEGRFFGDTVRMTRSAAKLRWPKKKDVIDKLPAYTNAAAEGDEKQAREGILWSMRESTPDDDSAEVEIHELYVQLDYDGDGVAEWRQVCMGGIGGERSILSNDEWAGPIPYVSLTPNPMPHRWRGRSVFDDVAHIQRVKTQLIRQLLTNLYLVNNPMKAINAMAVDDKDQAVNIEIGGILWTNGPPREVVADIVVPFVAEKVYGALEYWDLMLEKRTGVSRASPALDLEALQNVKTGVANAQQSLAYSKVETYARNIAECGGLRELFSNILKLLVQNQKSVKQVRIRDKFVNFNPTDWNPEMSVTINVGLGSGMKERDLGVLQGVAQKQELVIQALGDPFNPFVNLGHALETYRKMVEAAGLKRPEQYFPVLTQQQMQQFAQMRSQTPQPTPEDKKIMGDMKIEQMRGALQERLAGINAAAEQKNDENRAKLNFMEAMQQAEVEKVQMMADIASREREAQAKIQIAQMEARLEAKLAVLQAKIDARESAQKMALEREKHHMKMMADRETHEHRMEEAAVQSELQQQAKDGDQS